MEAMEAIDWIAKILVFIGGLNWLLYAFNYNLIEKIFEFNASVEKVVYILVGISAFYLLYTWYMAAAKKK